VTTGQNTSCDSLRRALFKTRPLWPKKAIRPTVAFGPPLGLDPQVREIARPVSQGTGALLDLDPQNRAI